MFFFNDTATTEIYTLSLHDALPILEQLCVGLERDGLVADCVLAAGDPAAEISAAAEREGCDLIAMSTHGHRFLQDLVRGRDRKSTRLNSSHANISYAVFCLKKTILF